MPHRNNDSVVCSYIIWQHCINYSIMKCRMRCQDTVKRQRKLLAKWRPSVVWRYRHGVRLKGTVNITKYTARAAGTKTKYWTRIFRIQVQLVTAWCNINLQHRDPSYSVRPQLLPFQLSLAFLASFVVTKSWYGTSAQ